MTWRRARGRKDANHASIVEGLLAVGCSVLDLSEVGKGCPDVAVGVSGVTVFLEIKRPGVAGKKRGAVQARTNKAQSEFRAKWYGGPVAIVETLEQALEVLQSNATISPSPYERMLIR